MLGVHPAPAHRFTAKGGATSNEEGVSVTLPPGTTEEGATLSVSEAHAPFTQLPDRQSAPERHATQLALLPVATQKGVAPPHESPASHAAPLDVEMHGTFTFPSHRDSPIAYETPSWVHVVANEPQRLLTQTCPGRQLNHDGGHIHRLCI